MPILEYDGEPCKLTCLVLEPRIISTLSILGLYVCNIAIINSFFNETHLYNVADAILLLPSSPKHRHLVKRRICEACLYTSLF
jgi:hypothetical protein